MGTDKATFPVDGVAMAERVASAAHDAGASEILLVGGTQARAKKLPGTWKKDAYPGEGPLGGVITALKAAEHDSVVVLSCDMPFITSASVACGLHAGDANTMHRLTMLAKQNRVSLGVHPGFNDLWGFGRRKIDMGEIKPTPAAPAPQS